MEFYPITLSDILQKLDSKSEISLMVPRKKPAIFSNREDLLAKFPKIGLAAVRSYRACVDLDSGKPLAEIEVA